MEVKEVKMTDSEIEQLKTIGFNLRKIMRQKNINSVTLHRHLGISTGTVSKIWNAKCNASIVTLLNISSYLDIDINDLLKKPSPDSTKGDSKDVKTS